MNHKQTGRRIGTGPDLQALLSYAYAVQCFRVRQQQALTKLAWHALEAVPGQSLAVGAVERQHLKWLTAVSQAHGQGAQLALPPQIADLQLTSFGAELSAAESEGQYPVHVYPGAGTVPSTAYVLIGRGADVLGVLAICRYTEHGFSENDIRLLRIFGMSVEQVLGWTPSHPVPEGLHEVASLRYDAPDFDDDESEERGFDAPADVDDLRGLQMFDSQAPGARSFGLKVGMSLVTLTLAGLGFLGFHSRQTGQAAASQKPAFSGSSEKSDPVAPPTPVQASTPSIASAPEETPRTGLRVENPDPGVTVWEPSAPSHAPVTLNMVRVRKQKDQLFLIFEMSGDTGLKIEHFHSPEKIVLQFAGTKMPKRLKIRGNDPVIAGLTARATKRGSEVQIRLNRRSNVVLVGPTSNHHVIINLQG